MELILIFCLSKCKNSFSDHDKVISLALISVYNQNPIAIPAANLFSWMLFAPQPDSCIHRDSPRRLIWVSPSSLWALHPHQILGFDYSARFPYVRFFTALWLGSGAQYSATSPSVQTLFLLCLGSDFVSLPYCV